MTAAVQPQAPPRAPPELNINVGSLPYIDMSTLTQSELQALSLCSLSAPRNKEDIVTPIIDRSVFNESAGSRRQTFSRPHQHPHQHRHRLAGLLPLSKPPPNTVDPDPVENSYIIRSLKQLLTSNPNFNQQDFEFINSVKPPPPPLSILPSLGLENLKRKRGRKPKVRTVSSVEDRERAVGLRITNKNGVVVDLVKLANLEDPYGEELRRRTAGMERDDELLGFFSQLGGQWCSRRKKRKIVDASVFGNALPDGWKLLLGLRRREGRASVYCRRYISPGGQHFVSCKEVSAYLQSYFGCSNMPLMIDQADDNIQKDNGVASESHAGIVHCDDRGPSIEYEEEDAVLVIDNLAEVPILELFECHKCNVKCEDKDTYFQHLLSSFHRKTTKRHRFGSVGDGVIVKDGKYECQFCHKVFHEKRRYNSHVGIHVRNYVSGREETPANTPLQKKIGSPTGEEMRAKISRMDALIEIAQNSILEDSSAGPSDEPNNMSICDKHQMVSIPKIPASISDCDIHDDSTFCKLELSDGMINENPDKDLDQQKIDYTLTGEKIEEIDNAVNEEITMDSLYVNGHRTGTSEGSGEKDCLAFPTIGVDKSNLEQDIGSQSRSSLALLNEEIFGVENNVKWVSAFSSENPNLDEMNDCGQILVEMDVGINNGRPTNDTMETVRQTSEEKKLHSGVPESSMPSVQPLHDVTFNDILDQQRENEFCSIDQRLDNTAGFEELRLDEMEQIKFSFGAVQESLSPPKAQMEFKNNSVMGGTYGSSLQFGAENMLSMACSQQLTTTCMWCGMEFDHQAIESEIQSNSVGYMCPTCKAKISGQLNFMDNVLP
ncbi:hypothetical protein HS088_TW17G00888 [Tripterygium wilfordii]|uniref:Methyl-CpG-binding domain-containing protein 8 n=1 Tax=Tripterygium wilfordii TaxID=458696 RepID=A0A7J7CH37_TRIWF|nr:uncharacterized protein LOC119982371 [Tripterygium wilfordii]XP_038681627.1 uncharacterized protein LOC119982371 [Tripterygium wilfordii]KAF5733346.1 hypothetical protein HS088_TW17G00888 [Tripterygium wilfordii]